MDSIHRNLYLKIISYVERAINVVTFIFSMLALILGAYIFGFGESLSSVGDFYFLFRIILYVFFFCSVILFIIKFLILAENLKFRKYFSFLILLIAITLEINYSYDFIDIGFTYTTISHIITIIVLFCSLIYISNFITRLISKLINPMAVFSSSFFIIIMLGTVLLSFPNCIYEEGSLSLIDALFISTSATCVTGLCPVDFPVVFTQYGQIIVLFLIQIGGLGIITITSFFALSIMGAIPFRSTLMIKDFIMESNSSNISGLLHRVIYTTLAIEAIGAIFIYFTLRNQLIIPKGELLYFSVFHSISAFCNAGFSIWPGGLCTPDLIQNNYFYYIISALIILGGIGFPIYSNLFKIISTRIKDTICMIKKRHYTKTLHSWDLNSIIVIKVTAILLLFSTAYFLIFEWNGILNGLSISQKIAQAFFNAVLPRTAGFSSQDISSLSPLTFIVIILLMWIGGAPQSTAGGIKVTSFYLMIKNSLALLTERGKLESNKREISRISVQRAFASIFLTTLTIFAGCILLMFTEDGIQVHRLLFEVVSAIGTVGSSMNVTPELSNIGKVIITVIMFIGRIGIITFITSFIHHKKTPYYRYPEGHIIVS